jgi:hypothetical protein
MGVSSVKEYQFTKITKFQNCKISCTRSLITFFALDTHTNIGYLDHPDIIAPIANR